MADRERPPQHPPNFPPLGNNLNGINSQTNGHPARPPPALIPPGMMNMGMPPEMLQAAQMQLLNQWRAQMQIRPMSGMGGMPQSAAPAGFRAPNMGMGHFQAGGRPAVSRPPIPVPVPMGSNSTVRPVGSSMRAPLNAAAERPGELRVSPNASPLLRPPIGHSSSPTLNGIPPSKAQAASANAGQTVNLALLPIFQHFSAIPPYNSLMTEVQFLESLSRFMALINLPLRKIPHFKDRPIPMHALYRIVTAYGGFHKVSETNRWNAVAVSLSFSPITPELLAQLKSFYYTLFFAYEQVFHSKIPLDRVAWPHAVISQLKEAPSPSTSADVKIPSAPPQSTPLTEAPLTNQAVPDATLMKVPRISSSPSEAAQTIDRAKGSAATAPPPQRSASPPSAQLNSNVYAKTLVADKLGDVLRMSVLAQRKLKSNLLVGKVSYEEITLMLASTLRPIQCAALGILERLSFDASTTNQPTQSALMSMMDALCDLFTVGITEEATKGESASLAVVPESSAHTVRPFDFLKRKAECRTFDIFQPMERTKSSLLESIVNIIRNWVTRPEPPAMIAKHDFFIWRILFPTLSKPEIWRNLNTEVYQGLWLIMLQVSPHISLTECAKVIDALTVAVAELEHCMIELTSSARLMHPAFIIESNGTEAVKKAIIQFIKVSNQFWRQLPPHCFLLLDFICRTCSNVGLGGIFDSEEHGLIRGADPLVPVLQQLLSVLWLVVENFVMIALGVAFLIERLLRLDKSPNAAIECRKYSESVLHNVQFSLPDGGYLELALLCTLHILRRSSPEVYERWAIRASPRMISWCDSLRRLWMNSASHSGPEGKSPLFTQPFTASSSQPYLVLIRFYAILGHLSYHLSSLEGAGTKEVELIAGWLVGSEGTSAGRELLARFEFLQVAELLLGSINL